MILDLIKREQIKLRIASVKDMTGDSKVKASCLTTLMGELETLAKKGKDLDDVLVIQLIKKFLKGNKEMQQHCTEEETARKLFLEVDLLESFLPKQLSDEELIKVIDGIIQGLEESSDKVNMGDVMKSLKQLHDGLFDGRKASSIVKGALT